MNQSIDIIDLNLTRAERRFATSAKDMGTLEVFTTATGKTRGIVRGHKVIASALSPNGWNHNSMDTHQLTAIGESLSAYWFVSEILCRVHPDSKSGDEFQIVDGEHRFMKVSQGDVIPINVLLGFDEPELKKLTAVMDESHGDPDASKLVNLLASIQLETGATDEELSYGLPFSAATVKAIASGVSSGDESSSKPASESEGEPEPECAVETSDGGASSSVPSSPPPSGEQWRQLSLVVPPDANELVQMAYDRIDDEVGGLHDDPSIAWGRVLELLSAEFLAS